MHPTILIIDGIDITPYATKNEKGKKEAIVRLNPKVLIMSGTRGPIILDKKEITKNTRKIKPTNNGFFFI
jgi:hypothetical protein